MSSVVSSLINPLVNSLNSNDAGQQAALTQTATPEQLKAQQDAVLASQAQQAAFAQATGAQNGLANQANVFNQMQGVADGTGMNPAQAMLANSTGANVANQAALMASQRGAASNPALIARQAAMQGANTQQQAAGQGAALQAQQSLGALNQMGGIAGQQVAQQGNASNAQAQGALQGQNNLLDAAGQNNAAQLRNTEMSNAANATRNSAQSAMFGNLMGAAGSALGMMSGAGPATAALGMLGGGSAGGGQRPSPNAFAEGGMAKSAYGRSFAEGGPVPALVSPGEKYLDPQAVSKVEHNGANPMTVGEHIPGTAKVGGAKDSYANDTVHKTLQEGGIVIPRSITEGKDAGKKAKAFVEAILKKNASKKD